MKFKLWVGVIFCVVTLMGFVVAAESWPTLQGNLQWQVFEVPEKEPPKQEAPDKEQKLPEEPPLMKEVEEIQQPLEEEPPPPPKEKIMTEEKLESQPEPEPTPPSSNPMILMKTSMGEIHIELFPNEAPKTVENFLTYMRDEHYNGTIFHRVIDGFMIQGGGFTKDLDQKKVREPIENEANENLRNDRGTIVMARTMEPHSATSQFFINVVDNPFLNFTSKTHAGYGYCVFGKVTDGLEVIDQIRKVETTTKGHFQNVPVEPVEILSVNEISE